GPKDEGQVLKQAPVIDVPHVEQHPLFEGDLIAPADLPNAREARADGETGALPSLVLRSFAGERRARSHERHVAAKDVDELGKLVEAVFSNEAAHGRDPRIVLHLEDRPGLLIARRKGGPQSFGVRDHGPKLEHAEGSTVQADALLPEEEW